MNKKEEKDVMKAFVKQKKKEIKIFEKKKEKEKNIQIEEVSEPQEVELQEMPSLTDDIETLNADNEKVDNPFIELRNLITKKGIDTRTILTEQQAIRLHRLRRISDIYHEEIGSIKTNDIERLENMRKCKSLVDSFGNDFMTLIINTDGTSRKQFIDALHKGAEKAEEAKAVKLESKMMKL